MKLKDEQKSARLIQAAITLLATGGLTNFSTIKVAKQAGIPQSNVYIYFKNKQALLTVTWQAALHAQSVAVATKLDENAPLTTQLVTSIAALYAFARAQPQVVAALQVFIDDPKFKQTLPLKRADQANQQIQTLLKNGQAAGIIQAVDLNLIRYFLTRPVFHYAAGVQTGLYPDTSQGLATLTQQIMGAVLVPSVYQAWLTEQA